MRNLRDALLDPTGHVVIGVLLLVLLAGLTG